MKRFAGLLAVLAMVMPVAAFAASGPLSQEANAAYLADYAKQKGVIARKAGIVRALQRLVPGEGGIGAFTSIGTAILIFLLSAEPLAAPACKLIVRPVMPVT